ncbi:MAG: carboxypeptidase M32, partial [Clostridia bacterium]|nr:carboxypeptidase M32 [Clostridia bacterium]
DQVTYPLHIMVRYELEKQLVDGSLSTKDLPAAWNALMKEYLGVDVPGDSKGAMQDVHWPSGMFGYFPSYALGSAYASQILNAMKKDVDFDALMEKGDLAPITKWLNEHIHQYGSMYDPGVLLEKATGEKFNPAYYVAHLKNVIEDLIK